MGRWAILHFQDIGNCVNSSIVSYCIEVSQGITDLISQCLGHNWLHCFVVKSQTDLASWDLGSCMCNLGIRGASISTILSISQDLQASRQVLNFKLRHYPAIRHLEKSLLAVSCLKSAPAVLPATRRSAPGFARRSAARPNPASRHRCRSASGGAPRVPPASSGSASR